MNPVTFPLKLQATGAAIANLQQALIFLGYPVASAEQQNQRFGASTKTAVTKFQTENNLAAAGTVNQVTANTINGLLIQRGALGSTTTPGEIPPGDTMPAPPAPTPGNAPYTIVGEVVEPDGTPLNNRWVRAFDRALCNWRPLGEARTDGPGRYQINYDPAQLKAWGKTKADLKVEVYDPTGDTMLASSPTILQALAHETVNFAIGDQIYRGPDEYTRVDQALAPLLQSHNDLSCLEVADILILAREAKLVNSSVAYYVKAQRWAADLDASAALFYGLLRRNQPTQLDALLARPLARLWHELEAAKAQNIIKLPLNPALRTRLAEIQQGYLAQPTHPYRKLLQTTALNGAQQAVFTQKLTAGEVSGDAFWQTLGSVEGFTKQLVTDLKATFELQTFTADNTSLTIYLRDAKKVRLPREVAAYSVTDWQDQVLSAATVDIPDDILPGAPEPERRAAYAQLLYRSAELRYPTPSLTGQMTRDPAWTDHAAMNFFKAYPDFEFRDERILNFLQSHPEALDLFSDAQSGHTDLLRLEQLFHLVPAEDKLPVIQPLWLSGIRSAPQIAFLGRESLRRKAGSIDRKVATTIYRQAVHITSVALNIYLRFHPRLNSLSLATLQMPQLTSTQALARSATALPEWEQLFGSPDACECSHCESALSPAAYLVDMMAYLERAVDSLNRTALDELLERRPDLGTLQLTCENTETELPQIDLVIEIMEQIVASADGRTLPANGICTTTWDSGQLDAQAEYLNPAAYEVLREAVYPFDRLPFDLWAEEGRRYLRQMGIARDELMRGMPLKLGVRNLEIATESLGMISKEREIIRKPNTTIADLAEYWGIDLANGTLRTQLVQVETLLHQARIDYDTLLRLLNTRHVNPDRLIVVTFTNDPCALNGAELSHADGSEFTGEEFRSFLDRLHRFLRLQQRLAWTEYELDMLLPALAIADFNAENFPAWLADIKTLMEKFSLPISEMCSWWGNLDTYGFEEELLSRYEVIFLNPLLFPDTYAGTGPDLRNKVFKLTLDRSDLVITTSTDINLSPWLAESDGATPPVYTLQADYGAYIQSATRLTSSDLQLLVSLALPKDAITGHIALNLVNVSLLYRIGSLLRALKISVTDYLQLIRLTGIAPLSSPNLMASPSDSVRFIELFSEIEKHPWPVAHLAYLLLHDADAAIISAPTIEDMDIWLATMSPSFLGILDLVTARENTELKAALTQSLASALVTDAAVLDALLFTYRTTLGDDLLAHLIVRANPGANGLPVPGVNYYTLFEQLHKFVLAWSGLKLDMTHLAFLLGQGVQIGWTDIAALPLQEQSAADLEGWCRLVAAADLQAALFTNEQSLFGLMVDAQIASNDLPNFVPDEYLAQLSEWSAWPLSDLAYLIGPSGFNFILPTAMQDERAFVALRMAFDLFRRAGVSAEQAHAWTIAELTYAETQSIKQALSLAYPVDHWLPVLAAIQDELRPLKRDALLGYLLHTLSFEDSTAFYHHYLIDPEQGACARTSRIVEAHAAIQIFTQRILFNLEPFSFTQEDAEAWAWRKRYRVWEAARKVFLYPENWLYPEVRDNKSVFFKELEDGLLQDDVNLDTAERLYQEYLYKLDQVSRLEIMGLYQDEDMNVLYVFGRTKDIPHLHFYRRWEDQARWTPWERVELDIQGDHLVPIVYNGRLYLFWPNFTITQNVPNITDVEGEIGQLEELIDTTTTAIEDWPEAEIGAPSPLVPYLSYLQGQLATKTIEKQNIIDDTIPFNIELELAWSKYQDTKWEAKKLSGKANYSAVLPEYKHYFLGSVDQNNQLSITAYIRTGDLTFLDLFGGLFGFEEETIEDTQVARFTLDSCQDKIIIDDFGAPSTLAKDEVFISNAYENFNYLRYVTMESEFEIQIAREVSTETRTVLRSANMFNYYYAHQYGVGGSETSPFFFADAQRSYFVQPLPDAIILPGLGLDIIARTENLLSGARLVPRTDQQAESATTHYQGTNTTQIIDHSLLDSSPDALTAHIVSLESIIEEDSAPSIIASESATLTGFRYRFTRFYHPYTCLFLKQLSRYGVEGLLNPLPQDPDDPEDPDSFNLYRQMTPLETFDFQTAYDPNFDWVYQNLSSSQAETLDEKIDFDHWSSYGSYNWELFFHIPLMVATRLMQNQRYADARRWFHYIFDPTCTNGEGTERFWKIKPFYEEQLSGGAQTLQELLEQDNFALEQQVQEWEETPFQPHVLARLRISAYMQTTVMHYLDCLIAEADMLFTRFTREDINEAAQLYLLAGEILGERPTLLPPQEADLLTPNLLLGRFKLILGSGLPGDPLDLLVSLLSNSLPGIPSSRSGLRTVQGGQSVDTTAIQPFHSGTTTTITAQGGTGAVDTLLLFCIPHNDMLYSYWNTVADRLFKIRHCMNIEGQVRQLPLFAPPIDPALLVRASAAGLDIASIISGLYAPLPNYRFSFMLQKALEICGEVRNLGGALLSALEKKDGEELGMLRVTHEVYLLQAVRIIKNKQIEESKANLDSLMKSKELTELRESYYSELLATGLIRNEALHLSATQGAQALRSIGQGYDLAASISALIPDSSAGAPTCMCASFGGSNLSGALRAYSGYFSFMSDIQSSKGTLASINGGYERRQQEWSLQADLAKKEIEQLDKQILAAEIRQQIAQLDLENHDQQITQAEEVEEFLKLKFTNQQLYSWMVSKISSLYFQTYQMALQLGKQAEQTFKYELGPDEANLTFVSSLYWDSLKKGLTAGEQLHNDLRRMEQAYLEANRRELEITKQVSLFQLDPAALLALRETGKCDIHIPEVLFDMDFPGHYFRRIKAVRLTIPCVVGPYSNVSATLSLSNSWTRRNTDLEDTNQPAQDTVSFPQTSIATSSANQDSGMFELNFNDPRYLPFEGAGAISSWTLELPDVIRQFDYDTITDVILHLSYSAKDGGKNLQEDGVTSFKQAVNNRLISSINDWKSLISQGVTFSRLFSLRQDFSTEWNRLLFPGEAQSQSITLKLNKRHFPKQLDYLWGDNPARPITLIIDSVMIFLNPSPENLVTSEGVEFTINDAQATVSVPPGLIQFNPQTGLSGTEITNATGAEYGVNVIGGQLLAEEWKDLYMLIGYTVEVGG